MRNEFAATRIELVESPQLTDPDRCSDIGKIRLHPGKVHFEPVDADAFDGLVSS